MHPYHNDFYGKEMKVMVLGYIRPEYNYVSKGLLVGTGLC
jgi:riboflavin kinase